MANCTLQRHALRGMAGPMFQVTAWSAEQCRTQPAPNPKSRRIKNKSGNVPQKRLGTKELYDDTFTLDSEVKKILTGNSRRDCRMGIYLQRICTRVVNPECRNKLKT